MLDPGFFERILKELSSHALYLTFYFQGEPYLHPEFTNLVVIARKHRMYTATSTNGHYLDDERARLTVQSGLDRLIISIDGASQATYEQYRVGGNLEKVLEGAKRMVDWKRRLNSPTPHIIFQFLVVKPNEHELDQIHSLARQIGVDEVVFKTAQVYDFENGHPLIPDNARYSRYEKQSDGKWHVKSKLENHCWKMCDYMGWESGSLLFR
jgi:MoaA/NifB/PqqE/SkfB family radical SAM enzyme